MDLMRLVEEVEERYKRYLETTFYFKDPDLRKSFQDTLNTGHLGKGPYLEATPVFKRGKTTSELFKELFANFLDQGFNNALLGNRPLYLHQEEAIRKVFREARNVVVATGTASGKTEAFLYPILLHLYLEFHKGELGPGVRALILYPMNALANDQQARLGEICKRLNEAGSPFKFTFGQYIGETPEDESDSRRHARDHIAHRLPGELVLRRELRENPPHILLTNYSMLEYLLIRPDDSPLFDNGRAQWWTFLVLDEAHQYRGSKGIEMAMLLRRLKRRIREGGRTGPFRCIATSATIAGGKSDKPAVAKFTSELFDEKFQGEDVILGSTESIPDIGTKSLSIDNYQTLQSALHSSSHLNINGIASRLGLTIPKGLDLKKEIGYILQHDCRSTKLRQLITIEPKDVSQLAKELFPDLSDSLAVNALSELVELVIKAEAPFSETPLASARYHLFLRSLEGAFMSYFPQKRLFLERRSKVEEGAVFEVALCRECGQHYLVGRLIDGRLMEAIRDPGHSDFGATFFRPIEESIEETSEEENGAQKKIFGLCIVCGAASKAKGKGIKTLCGHSNSILIEQQEGKEGEDQIPKCSVCGYRAPDPVREVVHGTDGPHAVIVTTLYQKLPEERRKVLAFADGRQEAAFFAWYLQNSYKDILNRNLILKAAKALRNGTNEGISLRELAIGLRDVYRKNNVFPPAIGDLELGRESLISLYREFLTDEPRISLEGVGLLRWFIKLPEKFRIPEVFFSPPWSMNKQEALDLIFVLLDFMRADRAADLQTIGEVALNWSDLGIQATQMGVRIGLPHRPKGSKYWPIRSWDGKNGRRAQFLKKILVRKGLGDEVAVEKAQELLRRIWEALRQSDELIPSQDRFLLSVNDARRLNPDWWRIFVISDDDFVYQCDTCGRIQFVSIDDSCMRHRCPGNVSKIQSRELEVNHYQLLYKDNLPGVLRVEEHTAQIEKEKAREFQRAFKLGEIHVLSSSTTFELGVDLGDLDTIFLRNVPPEAFNYTQRVGRAGRRSGFPGFAITFCRRNPHDLFHYAEPINRILKGTVRAPILSLGNEKIIARHITASALSSFFRNLPDRFQNVEKLYSNLENPSGVSDLHKFLQNHKIELKESLEDIVPKAVADKVGLNDDGWILGIVGENSRFAIAEAEVSNDFKCVRKLQRDSADREDYSTAQWAKRRGETIASEDALSFLSRKAIIPKYGFPVDVVELDPHRTQQTSESLEVLLQRDLSIAIAEFAPTSKLVANKREWTSYGIKKVAEKEWDRWFYCLKHQKFVSCDREKDLPSLKCCDELHKHTFILPKFGFVTDRNKPRDPKGRSSRVFTTRPYFVGLTIPKAIQINYNDIKLTKASPGRMVVLCEGRKGKGFYICGQCGAGFREPRNQHETPYGEDCTGTLEMVSLGHEFVTDVLQIQFLLGPPTNDTNGFAYSLAYALVEGSAEVLEVPATDLSTTVAYSLTSAIPPIVLYDNVPGGAGLVAQLEKKNVLYDCLKAAMARVNGSCGCGENDSCYGCLRSYRNQFVHQLLKRGPVLQYLNVLLRNWRE
jgi:superfamily II DNA/RNA helicase